VCALVVKKNGVKLEKKGLNKTESGSCSCFCYRTTIEKLPDPCSEEECSWSPEVDCFLYKILGVICTVGHEVGWKIERNITLESSYVTF